MMKVHNEKEYKGFLANFRYVEKKWMSKRNQWDINNKLVWIALISFF
jgi:hypothetical protein